MCVCVRKKSKKMASNLCCCYFLLDKGKDKEKKMVRQLLVQMTMCFHCLLFPVQLDLPFHLVRFISDETLRCIQILLLLFFFNRLFVFPYSSSPSLLHPFFFALRLRYHNSTINDINEEKTRGTTQNPTPTPSKKKRTNTDSRSLREKTEKHIKAPFRKRGA